MKTKKILIAVAAVALCSFMYSCVKEKGFEERVTEIAKTDELSTRIATVGEQVKGMEKSITQLQSAQEKLEQYAVKLEHDLEAAKTDIATNAAKIAALETELKNVEASIETIEESIKTLEDGLSELRTYVNDTVAGVKNWANATFATIDKTEEIATRLTAAEGRIQSNADSLRNFTDTVYTTVYSQFRKEISDSLASAESRIQSWVLDTLTKGYWTIAQIKWKLDSVARAVEVKDSTALSDSLKKASEDLTTAYKAAIKISIDSLAGAVNDTINNRIKRANDLLDAKITAIDTRLSVLETTIEKLVARIQSIEVVPMYGDGSVDIATGDNELKFDIRPASFADSLVKSKGKSAFSLLMTGRDKRPGTKASSFSQVTLSGVSFDAQDSVVVVKFRGNGMPSGFFDGTSLLQGTLRISDGNIDKGSAYFAAEPLLSANCFICGNSATGTFKAVKGNSNIPIGKVASVAVLWESFGTSTPPASGDVVNNAPTYSGGWISYSTGANNGNALIAAKDASGTILWSWHIWVCNGFNPETTAQIYNNDAGTMMDRNLGATSAEKGQVSALGLMYQWGRKDPFLGSSSISNNTQAASTPSQWPDPIAAQDNSSDSELNLRTSIQNPTTFIYPPDMDELDDWYCTIYEQDNDTLWNISSGKKTIYDPCPAGWRIPFEDGDENGVWSKASSDKTAPEFDGTNMGFNFGGTGGYFTTATTCWYPASGIIQPEDGTLAYVGEVGYYWSDTPYNYDYQSIYLYFDYLGQVYCGDYHDSRAEGQPVRCVRE